MAKKAEIDEVMNEAAAPVAEVKATKAKTVTVHLPRAARGEDNFQFVGVNGKAYKIQKGIDVEVPVEVAEVLENSEKMREQAADRIEQTAR